LSLAENLLRGGNTERALQYADAVLGQVTVSTLDFLTLLREKNPGAADQRYAALLASTANNMSSDANTVSLLSSYIFTPNTYFIYNRDGAPSFSDARECQPATAKRLFPNREPRSFAAVTAAGTGSKFNWNCRQV
jgi:hypothetical protein